MELVVCQSDSEILDYQINEQHVRFDCGKCGIKKFMKIREIEAHAADCDRCRRD